MQLSEAVQQFIVKYITSVDQLEILLLVRQHLNREWSAEEVATKRRTSSMATLIYFMCAATSAACAALLLRGYSYSSVKLLLWSGLCFVGLALSNVLLIVDKNYSKRR